MIQPSFLAVCLSSDIYGRPMLIELTALTITVHAGTCIALLGTGYCMYCRAKDGVSVGCLLLFHSFIRFCL